MYIVSHCIVTQAFLFGKLKHDVLIFEMVKCVSAAVLSETILPRLLIQIEWTILLAFMRL